MTEAGETAGDPKSNLFRLALVLILTLAAFIQLTVVSRTEVENRLRADAGEYFSYAFNLHQFDVYSSKPTWARPPSEGAPDPDKLRSPGYPLFLLAAGTPEPTEPYLRRVAYLQALLGVFSVWLSYLLASEFLGRGWALLVASITTISPHLTMLSPNVLTESLFVFLLLAATFALLRALRSQSLFLYAFTGLLWGACSLVRPTAQLFPVLLLAMTILVPRFRHFTKPGLLAFACFLVVLAPWAIRNQGLDDGKSLMVDTLAHGSYPDFKYEQRAETYGFPYRFDPGIAQHTHDLPSILRHIASRFRDEPRAYVAWYLVGKPYFFLSLRNVQSFDILIYPTIRNPYYDAPGFAVLRWVGITSHWPLMVLALTGMVLVVIRPRWLGLDGFALTAARSIALLVAYAIVFHMVVAPFPRYAIPFRPLLFALAMLPLRGVWLAARADRIRDLST